MWNKIQLGTESHKQWGSNAPFKQKAARLRVFVFEGVFTEIIFSLEPSIEIVPSAWGYNLA